MENSLKFLSEDFEAYLLLTHKELVSIENVHCDLIRIISMNLPIMMNTLRRSSTHLTDELIETLDMSLSGYKAMIQNHSKLFPILVELIKYLKRATNTDDEASEKEQKEKGKKEGGLERKNSGMMSITLMTSQIKKEVDSINIRKNQFLTIFREYNSFAGSSKNDEDLKSSLVSTDFEIMGRFFFRSELFGKRRKEELASMFMTLRSEANEERFRQFLELLITQSSPSKNNVTDNFILKSLKLIEIYSNSAEFAEKKTICTRSAGRT
jgi:hypothetical protein